MKEEFDVEKLANEIYKDNPNNSKDKIYNYNFDIHAPSKRKAFIKGFNIHKELTKDKLYTIEHMKSCFYNGGDMKDEEEWDHFIKSL